MTENEAKDQLKGLLEYDLSFYEEKAIGKAIKALEEIQAYRAIGTVEEMKALKAKAEPKKPHRQPNHNWTYEEIRCPTCLKIVFLNEHHCKCGQALNWNE